MRVHRTELPHKPFAAFLVCMALAVRKDDYREYVTTWLEPVRALANPVAEGFFAGALGGKTRRMLSP